MLFPPQFLLYDPQEALFKTAVGWWSVRGWNSMSHYHIQGIVIIFSSYFQKSMGIPITANMNQPLRTREFSIRLPRFHPEYFPAVTFAFLNTGAKPGTTETVTKRWRRILNFLIWKCWWKMVEMKSLVNPGVFVPATGLRVSDSCILWYCGYLHNIADGGFPNHQL